MRTISVFFGDIAVSFTFHTLLVSITPFTNIIGTFVVRASLLGAPQETPSKSLYYFRMYTKPLTLLQNAEKCLKWKQ